MLSVFRLKTVRFARNRAKQVMLLLGVVVVVFVWKGAWHQRRNDLKMKHFASYLTDSQLNSVKIDPSLSHHKQLTVAFDKADTDGDRGLSGRELSVWLQLKANEHVTRAITGNIRLFLRLDVSPRNGWVEWEEVAAAYRRSLNVANDTQMSHPQQVRLTSAMADFYEAGQTSSEGSRLTIDELLRFVHPEASHSRLLELVADLASLMDVDGDGAVSSGELVSWSRQQQQSPGPLPEVQRLQPLTPALAAQLVEGLDWDESGVLEQQELTSLLDIRHMIYWRQLAAELMSTAAAAASTSWGEQQLQLPQLLGRWQLFRAVVDVKYVLHSNVSINDLINDLV